MSRNRYVGDYRLVESINERGRIKTSYEYIGSAYTFAGDRSAVLRAKRISLFFILLGWAAFVAALVPVSVAAHTLWVLLPFAFAAIPLGILSSVAAETFAVKEPLEHRHADQLENRWPAAAVFVIILAAVALIGEAILLLTGAALGTGDLVFALGAALLACCGAGLFRQRGHFRCAKRE